MFLSIAVNPIETLITQKATIWKDSFPSVLGEWAKEGGDDPNTYSAWIQKNWPMQRKLLWVGQVNGWYLGGREKISWYKLDVPKDTSRVRTRHLHCQTTVHIHSTLELLPRTLPMPPHWRLNQPTALSIWTFRTEGNPKCCGTNGGNWNVGRGNYSKEIKRSCPLLAWGEKFVPD